MAMNTSRKDNLLIALGALLLAVGIFLAYALQTGSVAGVIKPIVQDQALQENALQKISSTPALGVAYRPYVRRPLDDNVNDWLSPEENEDNWDYDLFTTIDVVWSSTLKEYVPARRKAEEIPPFGLALVAVAHPIYDYTLESALELKGKETTFSLRNIKTKKYIDNAKLNAPIEEAPHLTITKFQTIKGKDADGFPFTRKVITLRDRNLGKDIEIDDLKPLEFTDITDVSLVSTADPTWTKVLHLVGDKFTLNAAQYTLKGIDLASKSVTFDKYFAPNPKKPKKSITLTETLVVPAPPPPPAPKPKTLPAEKTLPKTK